MEFSALLVLTLISSSFAASLLDVLSSNADLSVVYSYINASESLTSLFARVDNFTFLAPSNAALKNYDFDNGEIPKTASDAIEALLRYHLLQGKFPTLSFTNTSQFAHSLLSNAAYTNISGGQIVELVGTKGGPQLISGNRTVSTIASPPDLICAGGLIQRINSVLEVPLDVIRAISAANLQSFIALLSAGNFITAADTPLIRQVLAAPDMTYFAPNTPQALASFSEAAKSMTPQQISSFFGYHVVPGRLGYSSSLRDGMELTTIQGSNVKITILDGEIYVNSAKVLTTDLLLANGVLHTIDSTLDRFNVTTPQRTPAGDQSGEKSGLSAGAKAGIAIGVILAVLLIAALSFFLFRRHQLLKEGGATKETDDTRQFMADGDQRLVHRPSELEINTGSVRSYPSTQEMANWPKRWEVGDAIELDATGRK